MSEQLRFEFAPDQIAPAVVRPPADSDGRDPLLSQEPAKRRAIGSAVHASARRQQAVIDRRALTGPQLVKAMLGIRQGVESGNRSSIALALALVGGMAPDQVAAIRLVDAATTDWTFALDLELGWSLTDMGKLLLAGGAGPMPSGTSVAATHILPRPLPHFLFGRLRELKRAGASAIQVGDLMGHVSFDPRRPVLGSPLGRMRCTFARIACGLVGRAVAVLGDEHLSSLATGNFALVPKSRHFYVTVERDQLHRACAAVYDSVGWGPCVALPPGLAYGAQTTPTTETIQQVFLWVGARVAAARCARRYSMVSLVRFHNEFVCYVGLLFAFSAASRECATIPLRAAAILAPGPLLEYPDKRAAPLRQPRQAFVCATARSQLRLYRAHLLELHRRLRRLGVTIRPELQRWLANAVRGDAAHALCEIDAQGRPRPLGSGDLFGALPPHIRIRANAGRSYWATHLQQDGARAEDLDEFLGHHRAGAAGLLTTGTTPLIDAHARVTSRIEQHLARLRIRSLTGLAARDSVK